MILTGKILIVDDEKLTVDFFDIMLSKLNFDVVTASDGEEALEKIKLYNPEVILLDNVLPKMTGFEVVQKIKNETEYKDYKNIPIIMFSAINDPQTKVTGFEMGIDDYITKPFNFSEVLARIRSIFRHKGLQNELIKKERRLAILESLSTNLISFTRHIKKPLLSLYNNALEIDTGNSQEMQNFVEQYKGDYLEVAALFDGIEDEIIKLESEGSKIKDTELSLEELESKIAHYLKIMQSNNDSTDS